MSLILKELPVSFTDVNGAAITSLTVDGGVGYTSPIPVFGARQLIVEVRDTVTGTGAISFSACSWEQRSGSNVVWLAVANPTDALSSLQGNAANVAANFSRDPSLRFHLHPWLQSVIVPGGSVFVVDYVRLKLTRNSVSNSNPITPALRAWVLTEIAGVTPLAT